MFHRVSSFHTAGAFAALALAVLLPSALPAQQQPAIISTTFTALSLDGPVNDLAYDSNRGQSRSLRLSSLTPTRPQQYSGPAMLSFYTAGNATDGEAAKHPVGTVNLANFAGKEALLVFSRDANAPGQYRIFAIDDNSANATGNSWRVFNFTTSVVAFKAGDQSPRTINAGSEQLFSFPANAAGSASIQIATATADGWHLASTSRWSHKPQVRSLVFLLPGKSSNSVRALQVTQPLRNAAQ